MAINKLAATTAAAALFIGFYKTHNTHSLHIGIPIFSQQFHWEWNGMLFDFGGFRFESFK